MHEHFLFSEFQLSAALIGRKTFLRAGNKGFSAAVGYASRLAAECDCELVDRTGRLGEADCAALVDAKRALQCLAA